MMEISPMIARNWRNLKRPRGVLPMEEGETYAKYVVEPLERGYGHTLGNSLELLLLNAIRGAAVSAFKVDGVGERGVISGLKESVEELTLNLKLMELWGALSAPVKVESSLSGEVYARDLSLPEGVKLYNPDLYICTVTGKSKKLSLEVRSGYGYVASEAHEGVFAGFTPIDAMFNPVRRVQYHVADARVGQRTDYNRLTLEVWTSGALSPQEAIVYCAHVFREQMGALINFQEEDEVHLSMDTSPVNRPPYYDLLNLHVSDLDLPVRAQNCLRAANIIYVGELVQRHEKDMVDIKNFGKKSLTDIIEALKSRGLNLGMSVDWMPPPPQSAAALSASPEVEAVRV
jgi:DNA-directed RNA polymerase subunit alpha